MKLDREQDRQILLELINSTQIQGGAVLIVADLVQRIQVAETLDDNGNNMPSGKDQDKN